jgi:hypothetical protein
MKQVNNFFADPDSVRANAFKHQVWNNENHPTNGNWPGLRTEYLSMIDEEAFEVFWKSFYKVMGWPEEKSVHFETFYQFCRAEDGDSWVHQDIMTQGFTQVGVVYLSPNPPANSGTTLYQPKEGETIESLKDDEGHVSGDVSRYDIKHEFENIYNSAVIYNPFDLHKSTGYFGTTKDDARLTQVFFVTEK